VSLRFVYLALLFRQLEGLRRDLLAQLAQVWLGRGGIRTRLLHYFGMGDLRTQRHHQTGAYPGSFF
jgi:hypothetical protein